MLQTHSHTHTDTQTHTSVVVVLCQPSDLEMSMMYTVEYRFRSLGDLVEFLRVAKTHRKQTIFNLFLLLTVVISCIRCTIDYYPLIY